MIPKVWLRNRLPDDEVANGRFLTGAKEYDLEVTGEATLLKPDGSFLMTLRRGVIPKNLRDDARKVLRPLKDSLSDNRGMASGTERRHRIKKKDGQKTKRTYSKLVASSVIGYMDRGGGAFPYCRQTAFTQHNPGPWKNLHPFIEAVSEVYRESMPNRWTPQMAASDDTADDFRIANTPFTTITFNHNFQTATHRDKGDLIGEGKGASVMTVLRLGSYGGSKLVFPAFRVAVDMQDGDVIVMDSHEVHANTPFRDAKPGHERMSCVFYYRNRMAQCGTAKEELAQARARGALK